MNVFKDFEARIRQAFEELAARGEVPSGLDLAAVSVEPPRDPAHGDLATNAALVFAKAAGTTPRALAERLARRLAGQAAIAAAEVAGPGFVNLRLANSFWQRLLPGILAAGERYGASDIGRGRRVNVEYVSANPTGPLHVGHSRGAVFGDALAALLAQTGFAVSREYYINDAGAQVDHVARSVHLRYREALGEAIGPFPEGFYPGEYLKPLAERLARREGGRWRDSPEGAWLALFREAAVEAMMAAVREDLAALGIRFDHFASERRLVAAGKVERAVELLAARGLIYTGVLEPPKGKLVEDWEPRPQTLFRSTAFGDDVDRPLRKSDGAWTYFAADIAYHLDKIERGFDEMIDVWGADHGGYVKRMKAAVAALGAGRATLDVKICQLVNLLEGGEPVKMSKRAGTFVTLREVVDAVGRDVVRFMMLTRRNDAPLDFDLAKVAEQSRDNPVFYVQYAHARIRSVQRHAAAQRELSRPAAAGELERLTDPDELGLIKMMASWPRVVEAAAQAHEPHRLAFFLYDLASAFHGLWTKGKEDPALRFLIEEDPGLSRARLALIEAVRLVIASGLGIIGVTPAEEMR